MIGATEGPPGPLGPPDGFGPVPPAMLLTGATEGPPGPLDPIGPLPGDPGGRWALEFGSIFWNWSRLNWSFCTCV
ncbi:hypothetical protein [Saccharothrix sp. ALI-22-I]|uniref:hypothetical protein n=1 Tax=Saccharothrix sp. ALI-22-I TaxID=1933778 RepID=UPI0015C33978|nr:hypothetical protein [Saccharothrix sp. ALI-22-I]